MLIDLICIAGLILLIVLFIVLRKQDKKQTTSRKLTAKEIVLFVLFGSIAVVGVGLLIVNMLKTLWGYMTPL
jgi:peptidoglycan biosynthesis protein MviN/MurJ (putative lipid II flippase)